MPRQDFFDAYGGSAPQNYERYFVPAIGAPLAAELVDLAGLRAGERVLDLACGTGVVTRLAAQRVGDAGAVAGVDINPGMLAVARSETPPGMAIEWYQASAEVLPLPDETFDVVLCQMGLQFFPDKEAALQETRRVLAPGGRLVMNLPGPTPPSLAILAEALARHVSPQSAAFVHQVFSLHDPDEIEHLLSDAGFREVEAQSSPKTLRLPAPQDFLWQYVYSTPLAGTVAQMDEESRAALERDMVARWQTFAEDGALVLQLDLTVTIARK